MGVGMGMGMGRPSLLTAVAFAVTPAPPFSTLSKIPTLHCFTHFSSLLCLQRHAAGRQHQHIDHIHAPTTDSTLSTALFQHCRCFRFGTQAQPLHFQSYGIQMTHGLALDFFGVASSGIHDQPAGHFQSTHRTFLLHNGYGSGAGATPTKIARGLHFGAQKIAANAGFVGRSVPVAGINVQPHGVPVTDL